MALKIALKTVMFNDSHPHACFKNLADHIKIYLDRFKPEFGSLGDGNNYLTEFTAFVAKILVFYFPCPARQF